MHLLDLINKTKYTNVKKLVEYKLIQIAGIGISHGGFTELFDKENMEKAVKITKLAIKLGFLRGKKIYIKKNQFEILKNKLEKI